MGPWAPLSTRPTRDLLQAICALPLRLSRFVSPGGKGAAASLFILAAGWTKGVKALCSFCPFTAEWAAMGLGLTWSSSSSPWTFTAKGGGRRSALEGWSLDHLPQHPGGKKLLPAPPCPPARSCPR